MGCIYVFTGIDVPGSGAITTWPTIDTNGRPCVVPTFDDPRYEPFRGTQPKRVRSLTAQLVDNTDASWTGAVLELQRAVRSDSRVWYALTNPADLSKGARIVSVTEPDLACGYVGFVWTAGHSTPVPKGVDLWVYVEGD